VVGQPFLVYRSTAATIGGADQNDPEFHYVMDDIGRLRHKLDENRISLNEDQRKKELQDDKLRKETRGRRNAWRGSGGAENLSGDARHG